jgi:putative DNA primase/helicase
MSSREEVRPATAAALELAVNYLNLGWEVTPIPARRKAPPLSGISGKLRSRQPLSARDLAGYFQSRKWTDKQTGEVLPYENVALVLPPGIVGIDVDNYGAKRGGASLKRLHDLCGGLPSTFRSTSRDDDTAGIYLFRCAEVLDLVDNGDEYPGIDIIRPNWRYAMASPSIHPEGRPYRWLFAAEEVDGPSRPELLPELPPAVVDALRATNVRSSEAVGIHVGGPSGRKRTTQERIDELYQALKTDGATGCRHDLMVSLLSHLTRTDQAQRVPEVRVMWVRYLPDRGSEFDSGAQSAAEKFPPGPTATDDSISTLVSGLASRGVRAPDDYFDKHGLLAETLRCAVLQVGPIAAGPGETLWHWDNLGVWFPGGDNEVRRRCAGILGERHRRSHTDGVVSVLRAQHPLIGDNPAVGYINCRNGMLDWVTGKIHPHDPKLASTWQLSVKWNPEATCPTVDRWLAQVAPDDAINLMWQVVGASIYNGLPVHRAVLLHGPGRNGKGTFLRLVQALVGPEHCASLSLQALGENRFAAAELYGKAVNLGGDLDARSIVRTDLFKQVTGGDLVTAERKYGQPFQFTNRALMIFAANELPGTADHSDGFHSRWVVVPFSKMRLRPEQVDPDIEPRMHSELEGVLVKATAGLRSLMTAGAFQVPASVLQATDNFRDTSDAVRQFVDEMVQVTGDVEDKVARSTLFGAYKRWCSDENHFPLAASKFWNRVRTIDDVINVDGSKVRGTRYVMGIRLENESVT